MTYTNYKFNAPQTSDLETAWFDGQDTLQSIREIQLDDITVEVEGLIAKHSPTCSNEVRDRIAFDAFCDACEAWDIPGAVEHFLVRFPQCEGAV